MITPDSDDVLVGFSPDGRSLATGGQGDALRLWDLRSGEMLWQAAGHALYGWEHAVMLKSGREEVQLAA